MTTRSDPKTRLTVDRLIAAPRELVFKMLTDAGHLDLWWGPDGFKTETHDLNFAVGGMWRFTMHGSDGKDWPNWIRYEEITPPERIVYEHGSEVGEPPWFFGTITLDAEGDGTRITISLQFPTAEARTAATEHGAEDGGKQTLARLDAYVTGPQTLA